MKKVVIAALGLASFAGSALAADMSAPAPMYTKAPPPAPVMSWTGCYVGAGAGYDMWNQDNSVYTTTGTVVGTNVREGGRGWMGLVQGGCDYQFAQQWVAGAFADGSWGSVKGDFQPSGLGIVGSEKMNSQWAAGARLGYLPFDRLMVYGSAGWTEAHFQGVNFNLSTGGASTFSMNGQNYSGGFVGTGYEYAFTWLPGFFWKTEYRYSWLGSRNIPILSGGVPTVDTISAKKQIQDIRSELVWRFNWTR